MRSSMPARPLASLALAVSLTFFGCATPARTAPPAESNERASVSKADAAAAFDRLKSLAGAWNGTSTKGWSERSEYRVLAGGSAVLHTSFDAHPGEAMATLFHLDGDRLLLTHYCMAKNQPRLRLTAIDDGGATLDFTFLDATNLKSRDAGHMDRLKIRFADADRFTSRWTWYQDGKESWMEEIRNERVAGATPRNPG